MQVVGSIVGFIRMWSCSSLSTLKYLSDILLSQWCLSQRTIGECKRLRGRCPVNSPDNEFWSLCWKAGCQMQQNLCSAKFLETQRTAEPCIVMPCLVQLYCIMKCFPASTEQPTGSLTQFPNEHVSLEIEGLQSHCDLKGSHLSFRQLN